MKDKSYPLSDLTTDQLSVMASDLRSKILNAVSVNGGHLSSNLGDVELTMSLLRHFDPLKDDILFDVGHQTYAYKILTGRDLTNLRKTGGEAPFSDRFSSPYDKYNNGHAATSIATAYGIAKAKLLSGDRSKTVCVIGDSSVASGLAYETLNSLSEDHKTPLLIVINDNEMSISRHVGHIQKHLQSLRTSQFYLRKTTSFGQMMSRHQKSWKLFLRLRSMKNHLRNFFLDPTIYESMGIKYVGPVDGHDFESLDLGLNKAITSLRGGPVILHVLTKKGYGYKEAMTDTDGTYHGVKAGVNLDTIGNEEESECSFTFLKTDYLMKRMEADEKSVLITPAMETGSKLKCLFTKYPERTFDVGIAEEEAVTFAAGFALKDYHPIVDIYSTFLQRSFDEVMEDVSRERVPVTFFIERAGLVGADGESHQGIYDVSMFRCIPYARIYQPFSKESLGYLMEYLDFFLPGPLGIRIPVDHPIEFSTAPDSMDYQMIQKKGSSLLLIATGPKGYEIASGLDTDSLILLNLLPEKKTLMELVKGYKQVFFLDPYSTISGTDEYLKSLLFDAGISYDSLSLPLDFIPHGSIEDLYAKLGITKENVTEKIAALANKSPADQQ